jgi:ABC-2 type transport system permease protein
LQDTPLRLKTVDEHGRPYTAELAAQIVRARHADAALIIPPGGAIPLNADAPPIQLIADETQPMVRDLVGGMVQMAAGTTLMGAFEGLISLATGASPARAFSSILPADPTPANSKTAKPGADPAAHAAHTEASRESGAERALLRIEYRQAGSLSTRRPLPFSLIYLAGLVPMFLLFNANGTASSMLEELRSGATRRILVAPVAAGDYLIGNLVTSMAMSLLQCAVMYVFARVVFHAPIFGDPTGLLVLTLATAMATTGFGMLMASIARTPEQLNSIGTVVILAMSALGGSMFPRAFMPEWVKPLGLFTINGWAYDGFIDLIRGDGWRAMAPELAVLTGCGAFFVTAGTLLLGRRLRASA